MYKTLVDPDERNCALLSERVEETLDVAVGLYGEEAVDRCGLVDIQFYEKGRKAAIAIHSRSLKASLLQFSMTLAQNEIETMLKEIVPHEVAHLLCFANRWDDGHGVAWKGICMELGGTGSTTHSMPTLDGRLTRLHEAIAPNGDIMWLNVKQYKMAASNALHVRDHNGQEHTLTRNSLTGNIRKLR